MLKIKISEHINLREHLFLSCFMQHYYIYMDSNVA